MTLVAGVDLGGTKIAVGLVDDRDQIVERVRTPTPEAGPESVIAAITAAIRKLPHAPAAIGIGAPGMVADGVVVFAPNLLGWSRPVPLTHRMEESLGIPVNGTNDANAFALGEWVGGAGRGAYNLLGISLGTGIGGGLILDGRLYTGTYGAAGEFGHMCVRANGALCGCGRRGCVEAYAGRASMELLVEVAISGGRQTALESVRRQQGKRRLTSGVWAEALEQRDVLAAEVMDDAIGAVSIAVGAVVNLLDIDRIVVGGGLAEKLGQNLADRIGAAAQPYLIDPTVRRQFVVAQLGDDSVIVGAAVLARRPAPQAPARDAAS